MKKVLLLFLSAALMLSLCACGSDKAETAVPTGGKEQKTAEISKNENTGTAKPADTKPEDTKPTVPGLDEPGGTIQPSEPQNSGQPENGTPAVFEELVEFGEPVIEQWDELAGTNPCYQIAVPVKSVSDQWLSLNQAKYTIKDKDGMEIAVLQGTDGAPIILAPGQEGLIYYTSINKDAKDLLNPENTLEYETEFMPLDDDEVVPLEVTDVEYFKNLGSIEITGMLVNDTDDDFEFPYVSFLFLDENGKMLCGAFGMGGNNDYSSKDFGLLKAHTTTEFSTYRYWLPYDYPLEKATVQAFGFGLKY